MKLSRQVILDEEIVKKIRNIAVERDWSISKALSNTLRDALSIKIDNPSSDFSIKNNKLKINSGIDITVTNQIYDIAKSKYITFNVACNMLLFHYFKQKQGNS